MKKETIADISFFGLIFSVFVSLNSITAKFFGVSQVASPLILIFCMTIISIIGVSRKSFASISIKLLYGLFFSYYLVSGYVRLLNVDVIYRVTFEGQYMQFLTSIIIVLTVHQYCYKRLIIDRAETVVFNSFYIPIIISSLYSVYEKMSGAYITEYGYEDRGAGVFANPNALGFVANLGLLLTIYSLFTHKRFFAMKMFMIPTLFYVIFISLSRTSIITGGMILLLSIGWLALNLFKSSTSIRRKSLLVLGIPIGIMIYITINFESLLLKYTDQWQAKKIMGILDLVLKGKFNNETSSGRKEVFDFGFKMISENPIFGNGLGYFQYFPEKLGFHHGVHNTYLLILGDGGILPFAFCLGIITYGFYKFLTQKMLSGLISFGCIFIWALHNMGGHNGLDDKMANITLAIASMYLIYRSKSRCINQKNYTLN